jgi:large subunit ribosomal protein L2
MTDYKKASKKLKVILPNRAGRDNSGQISSRSRGGRHKRFYRRIDWKRDKHDIWGSVVKIEYDPNRSVDIALIKYKDGEYRYILLPTNLKLGDKIITSKEAPIKPGCSLLLKFIPIGVEIHNIELVPGMGGQMARSAGTACVIIGKDKKYAQLKLPSGEIRKVLLSCCATIGQLGNVNRKQEKLGKAGSSRHRGRRPKVRGVAMHPGSHPHGGGEGRSGEGMHPKTPWGKTAHGLKTRNKKKTSEKLIIKHRS